MNQVLLPYYRSFGDEAALSEGRAVRVYVAVTRASRALTLSWPAVWNTRSTFGAKTGGIP